MKQRHLFLVGIMHVTSLSLNKLFLFLVVFFCLWQEVFVREAVCISPYFCQHKWKLTSETCLTPKTSKTKACAPDSTEASTGNFCSSGEHVGIWWARKVGAKYFAAVAPARRASAIPDFAVCTATVKRAYFYYWHQKYLETHMKENKPCFQKTASHVI